MLGISTESTMKVSEMLGAEAKMGSEMDVWKISEKGRIFVYVIVLFYSASFPYFVAKTDVC